MKPKKLIQTQSEREQTTHRRNTEEYWKNKFITLSQENNQLLQKEKRYLEQLQILESRTQKQNMDALQLQSLYSQLMDKFQQKEMEIEELQMYYQPQSMEDPQTSQVEILKKKVEDLTDCLNQRKSRIMVQREERERERCGCYKYFDTNTPSASQAALLMGDVHKKLLDMTDAKTKLEHQNKFLVSRNQDLESIREELNKLLNRKQSDLNKTRDEYIKLIELEDATNKYLQKSNIAASSYNLASDYDVGEAQRLKARLAAAEDEAKIQTEIIEAQRDKIKSLQIEMEVRTKPVTLKNNDFFSFSQEKRPNNKHFIQDEQDEEIPPYTPFRHLQDDSNDLPAFPKELEIEELIKTMGEKSKREERGEQYQSGSERD